MCNDSRQRYKKARKAGKNLTSQTAIIDSISTFLRSNFKDIYIHERGSFLGRSNQDDSLLTINHDI